MFTKFGMSSNKKMKMKTEFYLKSYYCDSNQKDDNNMDNEESMEDLNFYFSNILDGIGIF